MHSQLKERPFRGPLRGPDGASPAAEDGGAPGVAGGGLRPRASRSRALERLKETAKGGPSDSSLDSGSGISRSSSSGSDWDGSDDSGSSGSEGDTPGASNTRKGPPAILAARRLERRKQREGASAVVASASTGGPPRGPLGSGSGTRRGAPREGSFRRGSDTESDGGR